MRCLGSYTVDVAIIHFIQDHFSQKKICISVRDNSYLAAQLCQEAGRAAAEQNRHQRRHKMNQIQHKMISWAGGGLQSSLQLCGNSLYSILKILQDIDLQTEYVEGYQLPNQQWAGNEITWSAKLGLFFTWGLNQYSTRPDMLVTIYSHMKKPVFTEIYTV